MVPVFACNLLLYVHESRRAHFRTPDACRAYAASPAAACFAVCATCGECWRAPMARARRICISAVIELENKKLHGLLETC